MNPLSLTKGSVIAKTRDPYGEGLSAWCLLPLEAHVHVHVLFVDVLPGLQRLLVLSAPVLAACVGEGV